jgi:hypothetical protein
MKKRKIKLNLKNDSFIIDDVLDQVKKLRQIEKLESKVNKKDGKKWQKTRKCL